MNILILTGKFGMGHWNASQSLRQQLLRSFPDAMAEVVDFPAYAMPRLSEAMYKFFDIVVSRGSYLFNVYYKMTALGHTDARPPFEELFLDCLVDLLYEKRPDVVIATHPLCAQLMSRLREKTEVKKGMRLDLPLITCVTDVTSHPEWINRNTDCYLVPSDEIRRNLAAKGVDPALICVTGIPVREEFRHLSRCGMEKPCDISQGGTLSNQLRDEREKRRQLLIMGGGLGLLPRKKVFYDALNEIPDTDITIITGNNRKLYDRLHGRWENIEVVGYTDRVWDYMSKADLLVTKPGGITMFEAIFAQVPIFSWEPTLQQERNNADWMVRSGIGWVAKQKNCAGEIREILSDRRRLSDASVRMGYLKEQLKVGMLSRLMEVISMEARAVV